MADQRPGRRTGGLTAGNTPPEGVRRRPAFRSNDGQDYEADSALDAARASGSLRGDLRGQPQADPPGTTYATRRRRVGEDEAEQALPQEAEALEGDDYEQEQPRQENTRGARTSSREPRAMEDRQFSEDRELTDSERVAMLRQGFFQVALPDLPKKPGLHRVWLTTTNQRDPIAARLRAGYRLLKVEDLGPGWEQQKSTSGEYPGYVMINEMVAAEIREELYQLFMRELHHNMPREAERGIFGKLEAYDAALAEKGSKLIYVDEEENALSKMKRDRAGAKQFE